MTQPYIGQIQPFAINFAPRGWAQCNGQILSISQYAALFSLLGTAYGGNGTTNFSLPDLRGRVPIHMGTNGSSAYVLGQIGGQTSVTLMQTDIPAHTHTFMGANVDGASFDPAPGSALAKSAVPSGTAPNLYGAITPLQPLIPGALAPYGGGQPHENMQPYLSINWCIALQGIFPPRN